MNKQVELLLRLEEIEKKRLSREEKQARVAEIEREIGDEELLRRYRARQSRSGSGAAPVLDNVCLGCGMHYPDTHRVIQKLETEVVWCEFCGRIVYPAPPEVRARVLAEASRPPVHREPPRPVPVPPPPPVVPAVALEPPAPLRSEPAKSDRARASGSRAKKTASRKPTGTKTRGKKAPGKKAVRKKVVRARAKKGSGKPAAKSARKAARRKPAPKQKKKTAVSGKTGTKKHAPARRTRARKAARR